MWLEKRKVQENGKGEGEGRKFSLGRSFLRWGVLMPLVMVLVNYLFMGKDIFPPGLSVAQTDLIKYLVVLPYNLPTFLLSVPVMVGMEWLVTRRWPIVG